MEKLFNVLLDTMGTVANPAFVVNTNDLQTVKINLLINQDGDPLDLTGATVRLAIKKPDKTTVLQDFTVVDAVAGSCEIVLNTQAYVADGKHDAEVMVYYGVDTVAVTGRFSYIAVKGILNDGTVESANEWQSINQAIADAEGILVDLRTSGTGVDAQARADIATHTSQLADIAINVRSYGAKGDGITDDTITITNAVTYAYSNNRILNWGGGTYVTTSSIPNFHNVKHVGDGLVKRGSDIYTVTPLRTTTNKLYVSPTGSDVNDGLSSSNPRKTLQGVVDILHKYGPIVGRVQVIGTVGTYAERVLIPDGLAIENNYLEFKFPNTPGVQGEPSTWTGAVLDGASFNSGVGFEIGKYNKVYIEYMLFKNWKDTGVADGSQTMAGVYIRAYAKANLYGCSGIDNGYATFYLFQFADADITGGIIDGGRHGIDNLGKLSLSTGGTNETDCTIIRNAREHGLYAKHQSSTVMDYIRFEDCGKVAGFEADGAAIFGYKTNTSIDTRQAVFRRNNICYHLRGAYLSIHPTLPDVYGAGVDANNRIWKIKGYGGDDLINYQSNAGRDKVRSFAEATTSSTTLINVVDTLALIPANYLISVDQYLEIYIQGVNSGSGTAQVRAILTSTQPTNYSLGTFDIPANSHFAIRLLVYPNDGVSQVVLYNNVNATVSGSPIGSTNTSVPLSTYNHTFKVQGSVSVGTNALNIKKTRCVLWG